MRLSTKSRFAVNALIDLALREQSGPVALAAISARQQISLSYLEQLFSRLRVAGLVESTRGPGGGYTLGRTAEDISVADIVSAVEGPAPADDEQGARAGLARDLWARLDDVMQAGVLPPGRGPDLHDALVFIQTVRMRRQAQDLQAGREPDNSIEPEQLSEFERKSLRDAFTVLSHAQDHLRFKHQSAHG
jgi:Rrf2 family protein